MVKNYKILYNIIHPISFFFRYYLRARILEIVFYVKRYMEILNCIREDDRFKFIKKEKDKYKNKRCFIIGAGPSLTLHDLELLKDEFTIMMSTTINIFDNLTYIPNIYLTQDRKTYERLNLKEKLKKIEPKRIYMGISNINQDCKIKMLDINQGPNNNEWRLFYLNTANIWDRTKYWKYRPKFSDDCYKEIFDSGTVAYSAIQLAAYMGFDEIYLLGIDCNYTEGKLKHFAEKEKEDAIEVNELKKLEIMENRFKTSFKIAYEFLKNKNVKLYNATRGGNLDVIPRVNLDIILKDKCKNYKE